MGSIPAGKLGRRYSSPPSNAAYTNLGNALEFRSQVELGYRLNGYSSVALSAYHISNAPAAVGCEGSAGARDSQPLDARRS